MFPSDIQAMMFFSTLLIGLVIVGVIIALMISNRRQVLQQVKMAQMQADYAKELRLAEQEAQEQVLTNVAFELHDNIGQLLTVMRLQLEQQKVVNPGISEAISIVDNTLEHTMQEVRRIGRSLNSELLDGYGLVNTMQQEVIRLQQLKRYTVHWTCDEEPALNKDQKVIAYRIFQESINNILKHARGEHIWIDLHGRGRFTMSIRDDGRGFDVAEKLRAGTGSGLKNMVKRAEMAGLECHIYSEMEKGTTFTLEQHSLT